MQPYRVTQVTRFSNISTANFLRSAFCAYGSNDFSVTALQIMECDTIPLMYKLDSVLPNAMSVEQIRLFLIACLEEIRLKFTDDNRLRLLLTRLYTRYHDAKDKQKPDTRLEKRTAKSNISRLIEDMKAHKRYSPAYNRLDALRVAFGVCECVADNIYYTASTRTLDAITRGKLHVAPIMTLDTACRTVRLIIAGTTSDTPAMPELPPIPPPSWATGMRRIYDLCARQ